MRLDKKVLLTRNSNIELLRIILVFLVILHHFNDRSVGGGNALLLVTDTFRKDFLVFLQSITVCAVDCFLVISGYFMYGKKNIKISKVLHILLIVIFYRLVNFLINTCVFKDFSFKNLVLVFLPCNYYAIFYCIIYLFSPYINVIFEKTSKKSDIVFICLVSLFFIINPSFINLIDDLLSLNLNSLSCVSRIGDAEGYSIVNFFVCFVTGLLIKKYNVKFNRVILLGVFFINVFLMSIMVVRNIDSVWNYSSIFVYVNSICLFLFFNSLNFNSGVINFLSKSVFSIFCIHTSSCLMRTWKSICISDSNLNTSLSLFLSSISSCILVFAICLLMDLVLYRVFVNKFEDRLLGKISFQINVND